jgi:hypothetical protein
VGGWVAATGCDAHVVQREILDPYAYIEVWLADAGLVGSPAYADRYRAWCDYFDRLRIEAVGLGWLVLRNAGRATPAVRIEDWPPRWSSRSGQPWQRSWTLSTGCTE